MASNLYCNDEFSADIRFLQEGQVKRHHIGQEMGTGHHTSSGKGSSHLLGRAGSIQSTHDSFRNVATVVNAIFLDSLIMLLHYCHYVAVYVVVDIIMLLDVLIIATNVAMLLQYCHYVAGLVGIGLSQLFSASGLEGEEVGKDERLANSMGLFLQKTNIIRDYLEDVVREGVN